MVTSLLEDWARPLLDSWDVSEPDEHDAVVLSRDTMPAPVPCASERIVVQRAEHWYPSLRHDRIWLYADKTSLGSLGLLVFAAMFSEGEEDVEVSLTNELSDVTRLVIERDSLRSDSADRGVRVQPKSFEYVWLGTEESVGRHPLQWCSPDGRPVFQLRDSEDESAVTHADLAIRDTLSGFGSLAGASHFAWLLLELSRPWVHRTEVDLESSVGFGGVGPDSAEMKIILPGDHYWPPHGDGSPTSHRL